MFNVLNYFKKQLLKLNVIECNFAILDFVTDRYIILKECNIKL